MLRFCFLSSGSCGNAVVLQTSRAVIMIDFGCDKDYILGELSKLNIEPSQISGVLLTHIHTDHLSSSGLKFLSEQDIPIYFHGGVLDDAYERYGAKIDKCNYKTYDGSFFIKDVFIKPFSVYHIYKSANHTLGFTLTTQVDGKDYKIGYVTDTGKITDGIKGALVDSNILAIESNYDRDLIRSSSRHNKDWVLSDLGHLSNEDTANAIYDIKAMSQNEKSLEYVFLAHLSQDHNTHRLALKAAQEKNKGMNFLIAPRQKISQIITIGS